MISGLEIEHLQYLKYLLKQNFRSRFQSKYNFYCYFLNIIKCYFSSTPVPYLLFFSIPLYILILLNLSPYSPLYPDIHEPYSLFSSIP